MVSGEVGGHHLQDTAVSDDPGVSPRLGRVTAAVRPQTMAGGGPWLHVQGQPSVGSPFLHECMQRVPDVPYHEIALLASALSLPLPIRVELSCFHSYLVPSPLPGTENGPPGTVNRVRRTRDC